MAAKERVTANTFLDAVEFQGLGLVTHQQLLGSTEDSNSVTLHTDGSWNPRVNEMGGGSVVRDRIVHWVTGFAAKLGAGDAFKAELLAIMKGLTLVWEQGHRSVVCYTDCLEGQEVLSSNTDVGSFWHRDEILAI